MAAERPSDRPEALDRLLDFLAEPPCEACGAGQPDVRSRTVVSTDGRSFTVLACDACWAQFRKKFAL